METCHHERHSKYAQSSIDAKQTSDEENDSGSGESSEEDIDSNREDNPGEAMAGTRSLFLND